jgi:hypothetical protein
MFGVSWNFGGGPRSSGRADLIIVHHGAGAGRQRERQPGDDSDADNGGHGPTLATTTAAAIIPAGTPPHLVDRANTARPNYAEFR